MNLTSHRELQTTREKLRLLEDTYMKAECETSISPHIRELTLRSLKGLINQLKEEITRYQVRTGSSSRAS